jgi:N-acetylneuraminic acid mutarotase
MPFRRGVVTAAVVAAVVSMHPANASIVICAGDCDGSGVLEAGDVALLVASFFENGAVCPAADVNNDGDEAAADAVALVAGIGDASCGAPPTPPPTPTATATAIGTPASTWVSLPPLPEGPRQEHAVASLDGKVYVVGGFVGNPIALPSDIIEVYDVAGNTWDTVAPFPLDDAHHVSAAVADGKLYAVGALTGGGFAAIERVYVYDPSQNEWTRLADLPEPRGAMGTAHVDGRLYAVGGTDADGATTSRHDAYDIESNQWIEAAPLPSARDHLAVAAIDGMVYAVGGRRSLVNTSELDRYDPQTNEWEVLTPMPTARGGIAAAVLNGRLVVVGGEGFSPNKVFVEVEVYDPVTEQWTALAPMAIPRHGMGAAAVGDRVYVPGGATRAGFDSTDVFDALMVSW